MDLLKVDSINKSYGKTQVLTDFSLSLKKGEIMGLIGANGSGKTTILKAVLNLIKIDSGVILINDQEVDCQSKEYLNNLGAIIEYPSFYESLTASQNLSLIGGLYPDVDVAEEDIHYHLNQVGLSDKADEVVANFSLGMKQRLGLAQALIHKPKILLLDEPFNGLDPRGIKDFREILIALAKSGVAIIVSSHSLEELNKLVDTVTVIDHGKSIFQGQKNDFLSQGNRRHTWCLKTNNRSKTEGVLENLSIEYAWKNDKFIVTIPRDNADSIRNELLTQLIAHDVAIVDFSRYVDNLEDVYLNLF